MNLGKLKKHKKLLFAIYLLIAFFVIMAIWYTPILFKGYPAQGPEAESIVLGRNYAQSGILGMENNLNVVMAPDKLDQVQPTTLGNRFTVYSYALIFNFFGWLSWDKLILLSIVLYALGAVFFTIAVYHLFGLRAAALFPLVYALLPFNGQIVQFLGTYEFALFYFALFTVFYFWGRDQKYRVLYLVLAGIFLALACMSREAIFVFLPIFFFWVLARGAGLTRAGITPKDSGQQKKWLFKKTHFLWRAITAGFKKNKKELLALFIPAALLLAIFWLPSFIGVNGSNDYAKVLFGSKTDNQWSEFYTFGHIFPDPYTFHFDKNSVVAQFQKDTSGGNGFLKAISQLQYGQNVGLSHLGFLNYFFVGTYNLIAHLSKFFAIEYIGGPIVFLLILFGFRRLKKQNKELYHFFIIWLVAAVLLLSYVTLVSRSHLMDFGWVIAALVSIGLAGVWPMLKNYFGLKKYYKFFGVLIILMVLYSLVLADHVYWGNGYDNSPNLAIKYLAQKVNNSSSLIADDKVIAVGDHSLHPFLNYLTGKSIVYFDPATVNKLIGQQKLQDAFSQFDVKYIIGYDQKESDLITKNSDSIDIADWPTQQELGSAVSYDKMWLLNIIK